MKIFTILLLSITCLNVYAKGAAPQKPDSVYLSSYTGSTKVVIPKMSATFTNGTLKNLIVKIIDTAMSDEAWDPNTVIIQEENESLYFPYKYAASSVGPSPDGSGNYVRFMYYDPASLTPDILSKGKGAAIVLIILHELGHFCNFDSFKTVTDDMEIKADNYAGFHIAKYSNVTLEDALTAMELVSVNAVNGYPSRVQRTIAVTAGYRKGKAAKNLSLFYAIAHIQQIDSKATSLNLGKFTANLYINKPDLAISNVITNTTADYKTYLDIPSSTYAISNLNKGKSEINVGGVADIQLSDYILRDNKNDIKVHIPANNAKPTSILYAEMQKVYHNIVKPSRDTTFLFKVKYKEDTVKNKTFNNSNDLVYSVTLKTGINGFIIADHSLYYLGKTGRITIGKVYPSLKKGFNWEIIDDYYNKWFVNNKNEIYYFENKRSSYIGNLTVTSSFGFR